MSNLTAIELIPNNSNATTGLFNQRFSTISANFAALNSDLTINFPSGETLSVFSNIDASGRIHAGQQMGIGATPSAVTTAVFTIAADSSTSDYIHFEDSSAARSNYLLGSRVGGTADGLNLWDLSGDTMIVSFSKQSIRFFQNVVGPVFDLGGALASTYNAATFGSGADSRESRIQAAVLQASIDGFARVYIPSNMLPYSASSVSFIYPVQMVREGGRWDVYDIRAYGASTASSNRTAVQQAFNAASANSGIAHIPLGRFVVGSLVTMGSNLEVGGDGFGATLVFNWFLSSGATSGGAVYLQNANTASGNSRIRLHDFTIEGDNVIGLSSGELTPAPAGGIHFRRGGDVDVSRMRLVNIPGISISYQGVINARFIGNYILGGGRDGITGGPFAEADCNDIVIANNVIGPIGDDGIAINRSVDVGFPGTNQPSRIAVTGNAIFGASSHTSGLAGRGILIGGAQAVTVVGNSIASTYAAGILLRHDDVDTTIRSRWVTITGNTIIGAGQPGDGDQDPRGIAIQGSDFITISGNIISDSSEDGIYVDSSTYVDITGNSITSNGRQILMFGVNCSSSTNTAVLIADNQIRNNAGAGIFLNLAQGVQVNNNTIIDNGSVGTGTLDAGSGILVQGTGGQAPTVLITNNVITDTKAAGSKLQTYGIRGLSTSNATYLIVNNRLSGNSGVGVNITGTPNSLIQYGNVDHDTGRSGNWVGHWSPSAFTAGTALLPGMSFSSEVSLGWYLSGVSTMALSYGTLLLNSILRMTAASSILPTVRFLAGSGNAAQMTLGRAGGDVSIYAANTNAGFNTGTRIGDSGIQANSNVTLHLAVGSAVPQMSITSLSGRGLVVFNQSGLVSIRTLAASAITASAANTNLRADETVFTVGGASGASFAIHSGGTVYIFDSVSSAKAT